MDSSRLGAAVVGEDRSDEIERGVRDSELSVRGGGPEGGLPLLEVS